MLYTKQITKLRNCSYLYNFCHSAMEPGWISRRDWAGRPKFPDLISREVKDFSEDWSVLKYEAQSMGTKRHFGRAVCIHLQVLRTPLFLDHSDLEE